MGKEKKRLIKQKEPPFFNSGSVLALRLLVLDCAEDEECGHNDTEDAGDGDIAALCNGENDAEHAKSSNDCAPNDAGLCLFGLVAVLDANDTGDKLYNSTYETEESRYDEQTAECAARKSIGAY